MYLTSEAIDPSQLRRQLPQDSECGGLVIFEGIIRDHNHGKQVKSLTYESYEKLAEKEISKIIEEAVHKFTLRHVTVQHRIGDLAIGDTAVFIAVQSAHRDAAFRGCRYLIDELKQRVPIWKKEYYVGGSHEWTRCAEAHQHA